MGLVTIFQNSDHQSFVEQGVNGQSICFIHPDLQWFMSNDIECQYLLIGHNVYLDHKKFIDKYAQEKELGRVIISGDIVDLPDTGKIMSKKEFLEQTPKEWMDDPSTVQREFDQPDIDMSDLSFAIRFCSYEGYQNIRVVRSSPEQMTEMKSIRTEFEVEKIPTRISWTTRIKAPQELEAIVVPTIPGEIDQILQNFQRWDQRDFHPYTHIPKEPSIDLVFLFGQEPGPDIKTQIKEAFEKTTTVKNCFQRLRFLNAGLSDEDNVYSLAYIGSPRSEHVRNSPKGGYKVGPNNVFFYMLEACRNYDYIFQMESDCLVIRKNWLGALVNTLASWPHELWMLGSIYRGRSVLDPLFRNHINGNAVYASGRSGFQDFIDFEFKPFLLDYIENQDPRTAFDTGIQIYLTDPVNWTFTQNNYHKFAYTDYIQNLAGSPQNTGGDRPNVYQIRQDHPDTYVLHGKLLRTDKILPQFGTTELGQANRENQVFLHAGNQILEEKDGCISKVLSECDKFDIRLTIQPTVSVSTEFTIVDLQYIQLFQKKDVLGIKRLSKDNETDTSVILALTGDSLHLNIHVDKTNQQIQVIINQELVSIYHQDHFACDGVRFGTILPQKKVDNIFDFQIVPNVDSHVIIDAVDPAVGQIIEVSYASKWIADVTNSENTV